MRYVYPVLLTLLISLLPVQSNYGQTSSTYEKGELTLNNSQVLKGYIWIADNPGGLKKVYFKQVLNGPSTEYSALDLVSINLEFGKRLIVSEAIPTGSGRERKLVEVHFKGNLTLISLTEAGQKKYYIIDSEGNITELTNSYTLPTQAGRYDLSFNQEYMETLKSLMVDESRYRDLLEATDYNSKSMSNLLKKYHVSNKFDYNIYPPPSFSGFIGGGFAVLFMNHQSDINQEFVSVSPLAGIYVVAGLKIAGGRFEISYEPSLLYGTIYHDDLSNEFVNLKSYYEDITRTSILVNTLNMSISPVKAGIIRPHLGIGISYNSYLGYSREVTEELYFENYDIVYNFFYDDFEKPEPFFGALAKAGVIYDLGIANSIRLSYGYNKYFGDNPGPKGMHSATISFIHNIY